MSLFQTHQRQIAAGDESQRSGAHVAALNAYDGHAKKPLTVKPGEPDDNVTTNHGATIVDKGVSFLFGSGVKIVAKGKGAETDAGGKAAALLEDVWPEDERAEQLIELATNGGIFGHTWAKIAIYENRPSVVVLDPMNMSAIWEPTDYRRVNTYRNQYNTMEAGEAVTYREDTTRVPGGWLITLQKSKADSKAWVDAAEPLKWEYPFAPVFEVKNLPKANEFYGRPDLSRYVLSLIHYIDRADSIINRIIRMYAHPKAFARGLQAQDLQLSHDGILFLPQVDQHLELLEMKGDLTGALDFRKQLRESLAEVSHVPEVATSKADGLGQLSGRAMQILYGPLLDRTKTKRMLYGRMLKKLSAGLLEVGGIAEQTITLHWGDPLPADKKEAAETAAVLQGVGVSQDTLMMELGYDPKNERQKSKLNARGMASALMDAFNRGDDGDDLGDGNPDEDEA